MGHIASPDREYQRLQRRYDRMVTGAPESPVFMQILKMLFTPDDVAMALRLPVKPTPLTKLAPRLGLPLEELDKRITDMAQRGLVLDFDIKGRRYAMLPPVVIGFFEFTFMRTNVDIDMKKLSELFHEYMFDNDRFASTIFASETQIGRSLVREEALPEGDHIEILDYERASKLVQDAFAVGVSRCACRHKAEHLGHACDAPQEVCMTLNGGAATMIRAGIAREVSVTEGMAILDRAKEANLAQTGDNVKHGVTYICNCCGCCCGMMNAIRHLDLHNAIVTSNWVMAIDEDKCKGCGKCVDVCPVNAIQLEKREMDGKTKKKSVRDAELCLGCGVCYNACKFDAIRMEPRKQRVVTPENTFDRVARMAIERGKLMDLIFDNPEKLSHRALGRLLSALEQSPPGRALMAVKPLRSAFLNAVASQVPKVG